jgi:hypothetical protein
VNAVYNRYIPQSDGTFQRNRMQDPHQHTSAHSHVRPQTQPPCPNPPSATPQPQAPSRHTDVPDFLKHLLPKEFDTGDLLIILLLLLMAGDCEEERSNALLTLALYFFL